MDGEQKFWVSIVLGIAFFVCLFLCTVIYFDKVKGVEMAKLGYEKMTVVGYSGPVWQKARD